MEITKKYFEENFQNINHQFKTISLDIKEIKETLSKVDRRDLEDSNAFAKTLLSINRDIETLKAR